METGWIKIHRAIADWEWFNDANTLQLFIYLIAKANQRRSQFKGYTIEPGQLITGRKELAEKLGRTEQEVRTAMGHLLKTGEITTQSTNKFTIVTICKYASYQRNEKTEQPTSNQQKSEKSTNKTANKNEGLSGSNSASYEEQKTSNQPANQPAKTTDINHNQRIYINNNITHSLTPPYNPPPEEFDWRLTEDGWNQVAETYNQVTGGKAIPMAEPVNEETRRKLAGLIRQHGKSKLLEGFKTIGATPYLCTRDLEWLLQPTTFEKILKHEYDEHQQQTQKATAKDGRRTGPGYINGYSIAEWEEANRRADARIDALNQAGQ